MGEGLELLDDLKECSKEKDHKRRMRELQMEQDEEKRRTKDLLEQEEKRTALEEENSKRRLRIAKLEEDTRRKRIAKEKEADDNRRMRKREDDEERRKKVMAKEEEDEKKRTKMVIEKPRIEITANTPNTPIIFGANSKKISQDISPQEEKRIRNKTANIPIMPQEEDKPAVSSGRRTSSEILSKYNLEARSVVSISSS